MRLPKTSTMRWRRLHALSEKTSTPLECKVKEMLG